MYFNFYISKTKQLSFFIYILCILSNQLLCRRGGGGIGRGHSSLRTGSRKTGGIFNGNYNSHNRNSGGFSNLNSRNQNNYYRNQHHNIPTYSKVSSKDRSKFFKNAIVGAAAGYLTYQAGKAIINHVARPMMYNNRPYYWDSNHFPSGGQQQMCRMEIPPNDPQFGNVYYADNTRPREIVWGCKYNEYCCGNSCCPSFNHGRNNSYFGFGSFIILILFCLCGAFIVHQVCKNRQSGYQRPQGFNWFNGNTFGFQKQPYETNQQLY